MVAIKGGTYGDMENFERSLKARAQGPVTKLDKDVPLLVRFLADPEDWLGYEEHFTEEYKYFPCTEDGCPGCDEKARASARSLAPALDVNAGRVIVLQVPKTVGETLAKRYKRNKTLMDRDYECIREGEGRDTKYEALPSPPTKRNLSSYEIPDLQEALFASCSEDFREYMGIELEEEEEAPAPRRRKRGAAATKKSRRRPLVEDEYDEDEDEEDMDEEEEEAPRPVRRRRPAAATSRRRRA